MCNKNGYRSIYKCMTDDNNDIIMTKYSRSMTDDNNDTKYSVQTI